MASLRGVAVTTATPFTSDLSEIDRGGLSQNLSFLVENGIKLIVPCGNTGEFYSLSEAEWKLTVQTTVEATSGQTTIMAGIGHSLTTCKKMISQVKDIGADLVMVMYPQHVFQSEEGILNYYRQILETDKELGIVLYKKGPLLSDGVLRKLLEYDNLIAVKYAFGRIVDFSRTVHDLSTSIVWSCGTAERFAPFFWLAGAEGFTSGLGNFAPFVSLKMFSALKNQSFDEVMRLQKVITPLEDIREGRGKANNVPVIKAALDHVGLVGGECRPPIHPLNTTEMKDTLQAVELILKEGA